VLEEGHKGVIRMHLVMTKMYHDCDLAFWWSGMKKDLALYIVACLACHKAQVKHYHNVVYCNS